MREIIIGLLILLSCSYQARTQQVTLKGAVLDTLEKHPLPNAVVSLLHKGDSVLLAFTRTDKNGAFQLPNVIPGTYVLLVTFPKFADYRDDIVVKEQTQMDIGTIPLTQKGLLLKEVVVRANQAIRIKGDTTEFAADSFVVREGATVDELLKKMPGFVVNSKGEITAQGKKVDKVLVDGEEFFGDDPTMATQNISAKAVDKVQVYDTKSEQENLKGITSGTEGKTVNIKLKEDKKKGAFGKLEAGTNFNDLLDAKVLYNNFVGKKKLSVYGTKSNTSTGSLDWQDRQKLGLENDLEYDEIGGYYYSFGQSDEFSQWNLRGLPDAYSAGGLYSNKWNNDRQNANASYRFNRLGVVNETDVRTQNILPDTTFYTNRLTKTNGLTQQHAFNGKFEWKLDSLASLKLTTAEIYKKNEAFNNTYSESLTEDSLAVNNSNNTNTVNAIRKQTDNQLTYKQLFKKKNRILMATLRYGVTQDEQNNALKALTRYYNNGDFVFADTLDQQKSINGQSITMGAKVTYSEPLSDKISLITEYSYNQNDAYSHRNTFDKSRNGKYETLNPVYSNNFNLKAFSNSGSAILKYTSKKIRAAFGSGVSNVQLNLLNRDNNEKNHYNFFNVTPQAQIGYSPKQQTSVTFSYRGSTRQPTIEQLQPIRENNDPLNVLVGNPNLKVGFDHNIRLSYNSFKILSGRYMYLGSGFTIQENAITNSSTVDQYGKRIYMPVNVNGNRNWYVYSGYVHGQGEKKWIYSIEPNANGGKNINFVNGQQSTTTYTSFNLRTNLRYEFPEKYSISFGPRISYNRSKNLIQTATYNNYYTYGGQSEGFVMLPGKLELTSDVSVDLYQKTRTFSNLNIVLWNANIARKVLKDKSGKIIFAANDILNQNKGINRMINSNFVTNETYWRRSRYFLLKFEWSFNKMPGAGSSK